MDVMDPIWYHQPTTLTVRSPCTLTLHLAHCFGLRNNPAGVRGVITRYVTTIPTAGATYHCYELDVASLDAEWLEGKERRREWCDYATAIARLMWKPELAQALSLSSLAPR